MNADNRYAIVTWRSEPLVKGHPTWRGVLPEGDWTILIPPIEFASSMTGAYGTWLWSDARHALLFTKQELINEGIAEDVEKYFDGKTLGIPYGNHRDSNPPIVRFVPERIVKELAVKERDVLSLEYYTEEEIDLVKKSALTSRDIRRSRSVHPSHRQIEKRMKSTSRSHEGAGLQKGNHMKNTTTTTKLHGISKEIEPVSETRTDVPAVPHATTGNRITFRCDRLGTIVCDDETDINPGRIFAERAARREYGSKGCVGCLRLDSWAESGRFATYQAFIGEPEEEGGIGGHNIWLHVRKEGRGKWSFHARMNRELDRKPRVMEIWCENRTMDTLIDAAAGEVWHRHVEAMGPRTSVSHEEGIKAVEDILRSHLEQVWSKAMLESGMEAAAAALAEMEAK